MPPVVIDVRRAEDYRDVVHRAVQAVVEGRLVAFPTETVYGLAAAAWDEEAVGRLLDAKGRQEGHPLTLAIRSAEEAEKYAPGMSPLARRMARRCWPGVGDDPSDGRCRPTTPRISVRIWRRRSPIWPTPRPVDILYPWSAISRPEFSTRAVAPAW